MNYDIFENIYYDNVLALFNLCSENKNNLDNVKINYARYNNYLIEGLNFLIKLDILKIHNNNIKILSSNYDFKEVLLDRMSKTSNIFFLIQKYLQHFSKDNEGNLIFKPNESYNIMTSSLRNLFISMKIIKHDNSLDAYILLNENILLKFKKTIFSPEQLQKQLEDQGQIGLLAEKFIFQKEIKKLSSINENLIPEHVSLKDVGVGYDIKSYIKEGNEIKEIYIEVKAVSVSNYKFHLSIDEYQTAIEHGGRYYVYLIPVDYSKSDNFDYEKILIINHVKENIINKPINWVCEKDGFVIYKNNLNNKKKL